MSIFRRNQKEAKLIVLFSCLKFLICLLAIGRFGFQRDEFLHLALARHPSWGYMEVPPFISSVSWLGTHIFGDSLFAVRILPSLFGAMVIYLTGLMVLAMGGKRFAISTASLGMIVSPAFLASGYLLQPVVFDQFFWALAAFLVVQFVKTKKISYLYWTGAAVGAGMMNKYTMLLYAFSLAVGLLVSSQRKLLYTKHLFGAALVASLIFLPNALWQLSHGLPVLRHMRELSSTQLGYISPLSFTTGQMLIHATGLLIWCPGFIYLFFSRVRSRYIFISIAYLSVMVLLTLLHGKVYYGFGAYPALFAAGGICWQRALTRMNTAMRYSILAVVLFPALILVPIVIPVLPFPATLQFFRAFSEKTGLTAPMTWEDRKVHAITQDYADMLGWDEMTALVKKAYDSLTTEEKRNTTLFAENYGQAGAIDHLGKKYSFPPAVSLSSSYALWAPDSIKYAVVILVSDSKDNLALYRSVSKIGEVKNPYAREKGTGVYILRDPKVNVGELYRSSLATRRSH